MRTVSPHLGAPEIDGIRIDIIGDIQKREDDRRWEAPVRVERHRRWVDVGGRPIPVLSLDYEYQAYLTLGRVDTAETLRVWLQQRESG